MTKVIVTRSFNGAPDGQIYPRAFKEGDEVSGDLARVALAEGWAEAREEVVVAAEPQGELLADPKPEPKQPRAKKPRDDKGPQL